MPRRRWKWGPTRCCEYAIAVADDPVNMAKRISLRAVEAGLLARQSDRACSRSHFVSCHQPADRISGGIGMKTFSDRWRQLDWDNIRLRINGKTAADVERALNVSQSLTRDDMMALLSPAASGYLEPLAQRAQRLTLVSDLATSSASTSRFIFSNLALTTARTADSL